MSLSYNYPPQMAYPSAPPVYRSFRAPPRLHWAWVLVLSIVTFGIFWTVWMLVQAYWVKKATGNTRAFTWALSYVLLIPVIFTVGMAAEIILPLTSRGDFVAGFITSLGELSRVLGFLVYIASVFMLKSALESAPIKIPLHGLATFFFGPVYFQYYLRKFNVEGMAGEQLSGFADDSAAMAPAANEISPQL